VEKDRNADNPGHRGLRMDVGRDCFDAGDQLHTADLQVSVKSLRLAVSALGQRAYVGRVNKAGNCFLDGKQDVTSDFFKAVIDYFGDHEVVIEGDSGRQWRVRCVEIKNEPTVPTPTS
jgi:ssDNA-binding replication factor A large subunit